MIKCQDKLSIDPLLLSGNSKKFENDITCMICLDIVYDCVKCLSCGQLFCNKCIKEWVSQGKSCPNCRKKFKESKIDRVLLNILSKIELNCPLKCNEKIEYQNYFKHVKEDCVKLPRCEYCHILIEKKDMDQHLQLNCKIYSAVKNMSAVRVNRFYGISQQKKNSLRLIKFSIIFSLAFLLIYYWFIIAKIIIITTLMTTATFMGKYLIPFPDERKKFEESIDMLKYCAKEVADYLFEFFLATRCR